MLKKLANPVIFETLVQCILLHGGQNVLADSANLEIVQYLDGIFVKGTIMYLLVVIIDKLHGWNLKGFPIEFKPNFPVVLFYREGEHLFICLLYTSPSPR